MSWLTFVHGFFQGAEAFAERDGFLYSGILGGEIVRFDPRKPERAWEFVFKYGEKCSELHQDAICGRPLGLNFDKKGRLVVCDSYLGIYRISRDFKTAELLISPETVVEGKQIRVFNSLVVMDDDTLYYTHSDSNFDLHEGVFMLLGDGSGRLMKFDSKTKTHEVLADGFQFANGIAITTDHKYLLVSETGKGLIWKYHLVGETKGDIEKLVQMPGFTDNIKPSGRPGTYITAIVVPINKDKRHVLVDGFYRYPSVCKLITRSLYLIKSAAKYLNENVQRLVILDKVEYYLANFVSLDPVTDPGSKKAILVEFDEAGKVLESWHSTTESGVGHIAEGYKHGDYIYLGSFRNHYFGRVPYKQ